MLIGVIEVCKEVDGRVEHRGIGDEGYQRTDAESLSARAYDPDTADEPDQQRAARVEERNDRGERGGDTRTALIHLDGSKNSLSEIS